MAKYNYVLKDVEDLGRPVRGCSNCGRDFQPTLNRRVLCLGCFRTADRGTIRQVTVALP